jgi:hypothetical protein
VWPRGSLASAVDGLRTCPYSSSLSGDNAPTMIGTRVKGLDRMQCWIYGRCISSECSASSTCLLMTSNFPVAASSATVPESTCTPRGA